MTILLAIIITYLYASIPFSLLVGFMYKKDIRQEGSKNVGGSNLGRICGKRAFALGFIGDLSKGSFAVLLAYLMGVSPLILFAFALLGHAKSIFNKFTGGKGVATSFGFALAYTFVPALLAITFFLIILKISKYVSLSAISATGGYMLAVLFLTDHLAYKICIILVFLAMVYLHRENIIRIKNNTERKITWM